MFTRKFTVQDYGWEVEIYEPTMIESTEIAKAYDDRKWEEFFKLFSPLIKGWNCVDRQGEPIPTTSEGLAKLPMPAVRYVVKSMYDAIAEVAQPKKPSAS